METLRAVSRWVWGPPTPPSPPARPFWVSSGGEGRPRGVLAATLGELREQVGSELALPPPVTLVLAEDGTVLEDEAFFGVLPPHTPLVALGRGEKWDPHQAGGSLQHWDLGGVPPPAGGGHRDPPEVAQLTLALAKGDPRDPLGGRLRLSAQIRGVRWDLGGVGPERLLRELLRLLTTLTRALGQTLLSFSAALRPLLEGPPARAHPGGR